MTEMTATQAQRQFGALLDEAASVLGRAKFDRYLPAVDRASAFRAIVNLSNVSVFSPRAEIEQCRDPDDDKLLDLATTALADLLVTGDKDLIVLNQHFPFAIVTSVPAMEILLNHATTT